MEIVFATNNAHKIHEIKKAVGNGIQFKSLEDIGCVAELPENQDTLEGNALEKANYIFMNYQLNCFADDTGLEIEALDGQPGVYSARFAGESRNSEDNMNLVLQKLKNESNRKARFRTVISLILEGKPHQFEGIVNGSILLEKRGKEGFGYDPIFLPDGFEQSFAEMPLEIKNKISHRGQAVEKLVHFLKTKYAK